MSEFKLEVQKKFSVSAEVVFDAWLDPESVKQWMCPAEGVTVPSPKIDAQVGGKFQFDMKINADTILPHRGEYKVLDRPQKIQFTWRSVNTNEEDSLVTINIESTGLDSCLLTLKHELLPSEESKNDHLGGWTSILETLSKKSAL